MFSKTNGNQRWLGWLLLAVGFFLATAQSRAQEVRVTVIVILGSDKNKEVDCQLKCLAEEIQKKEPKLTGFKLGDTTCKSLALGKKETFKLVDKEEAIVTVRHGADKNNRVGLTVKPPRMGEIDYTTCCGKFLPILTRYHTKDKERLIIAVRVQPCKGDKKADK
jgi:hypothetical protein